MGGWIKRENFQKKDECVKSDEGQYYIRGGPRFHIALNAQKVKACIMTCGGICPGMNVVIRELVFSMRYNYGVSEIYGIKWGFHGFLKENFWVKLNPEDVKHIHLLGGTVLGTSRYGFEGKKIADILIKKKIDIVFFIGGDGTHSGMIELSKIFKSRKKKIILVGIPKSIDNDLPIIDKSFGLESAIQESVRTIRAANVEANCNMNGIGLVKLFGRSSGFLAMLSSLAARDVNICLIPEIPFNLYGDNGLLDFLFKRMEVKEHCVIVVADGARFSVKDYKPSKDRSIDDIGLLLKREIKLAESAVHCAFAGFTNFSVGLINNKPCMIPSELLCGKNKRKISYNSDDYLMLLASTGQPSFYPETTDIKETDKDKDKIIDNTNKDKIKEIKDKIEENKINKNEEEKKNIFDFH